MFLLVDVITGVALHGFAADGAFVVAVLLTDVVSDASTTTTTTAAAAATTTTPMLLACHAWRSFGGSCLLPCCAPVVVAMVCHGHSNSQ
jgi:hypothetical protein